MFSLRARFLDAASRRWGQQLVLQKLALMTWFLTTTFTGLGCVELAAKSAPGRQLASG